MSVWSFFCSVPIVFDHMWWFKPRGAWFSVLINSKCLCCCDKNNIKSESHWPTTLKRKVISKNMSVIEHATLPWQRNCNHQSCWWRRQFMGHSEATWMLPAYVKEDKGPHRMLFWGSLTLCRTSCLKLFGGLIQSTWKKGRSDTEALPRPAEVISSCLTSSGSQPSGDLRTVL